MQKDGKFIGSDGSIPEGQGVVIAHLSECHELVEMVCLPSEPISRRLNVFQLAERIDGGRGRRGGNDLKIPSPISEVI